MNKCIGLMDEIFAVGNGTGTAHGKNGHEMKRNRQILKRRARFSLGDLILAGISCTHAFVRLAAITVFNSRSGDLSPERFSFWISLTPRFSEVVEKVLRG